VTLCRTYRRIRWSASVIRSLEAAEADSRGGISVSLLMHTVTLVSPMEIARAMTPSHSLGQVRPDRLTTIHYPCQLDPVMFKVETLLAAIRAVNWCQRDWQAQIGYPGRDRLATTSRCKPRKRGSGHRLGYDARSPT
jgi:hypothetical protein